eukprot:Gb_27593 [translate_table: standard]
MALSPSSLYMFYQNENIVRSQKETPQSAGCRAFGNMAFGCWNWVKGEPWPRHQFLKCALQKKSRKNEVSERVIPDIMPISGSEKLNDCKGKVSVIRVLTPHNGVHLRFHISVRLANIHMKRWSSLNKLGQIQEAIKKMKKCLANVSCEWSYRCSPQTVAASIVLLWILLFNSPAYAVDAVKTCVCLLKECRVELARCIANPACAANIACLQTCNNRPDETDCQIKCGDLFENSVVDQFNECAVSRKKCVPQKYDEGTFPVPDPSALVGNFNVADFRGKWYISSGLNPTFDTFDCQVHEFYPTSNTLTGKLSWRISTPDGGFFTRSTAQKFVQDPSQPGVLYNHDNEFLHYQDDWYILSSEIKNKPDDYIFVYYRGKNDAWDGYGGAVVYTRSPVLPPGIVPELEKAASRVGLDFNKFRRTDNTCGPEPSLVARLEKKVEEGEETIVKEVEELEEKVEEVGKAEVTLFQRLQKGIEEFKKDEDNFLKGLSKEEMELLGDLKMEAQEVEKLFGKPLPIRKLK